jgi:DNA-binding MarR family transcriptional regulator
VTGSDPQRRDERSSDPVPRALGVSIEDIDDGWDVDERLGALWRAARLGPTVERLRRHILQGGERVIEAGQFRALDAVAANGPCAVRELAIVMGLEPSSMTRALAKLEAAGWIEKNRSVHDHREVLVELNDVGREHHRYFVDRAFAVYEEIFVVFSGQERIVLADLLERMLKSTDAVLATSVGLDPDGDGPEGD